MLNKTEPDDIMQTICNLEVEFIVSYLIISYHNMMFSLLNVLDQEFNFSES